METQRDLARYWLFSMLRVVGGYLAMLALLMSSWYLVSLVLYPEGLKLFVHTQGPEITPDRSGFHFPPGASWTFIAINVLGAGVCGYLIAHWSRPRQMLHAIMLAIIVFATQFQAALEPGGVFPKWIIAVLMSAQSIAIVAGAHWAVSGQAPRGTDAAAD